MNFSSPSLVTVNLRCYIQLELAVTVAALAVASVAVARCDTVDFDWASVMEYEVEPICLHIQILRWERLQLLLVSLVSSASSFKNTESLERQEESRVDSGRSYRTRVYERLDGVRETLKEQWHLKKTVN